MDFIMTGVPSGACFSTSSDEEGEEHRMQYWGPGPHHIPWACWVQPGQVPGTSCPFMVPDDTIIVRVPRKDEYSRWRVCSKAVFKGGNNG